MINLSATQYLVLTHIRQACADGVEPCIADICVSVDMSFATVSRAVRNLYDFGLLTRRRDKLVDAYVYSLAALDDDICTAEAYHVAKRRMAAYPPCTGIAINQEPIYPGPMMRER